MVVNTVNVVLTLLKRKMYLSRIARGQQEECYGRSGQHEDSGRSRGQREELRTAGGWSTREWTTGGVGGQHEEWTARGKGSGKSG